MNQEKTLTVEAQISPHMLERADAKDYVFRRIKMELLEKFLDEFPLGRHYTIRLTEHTKTDSLHLDPWGVTHIGARLEICEVQRLKMVMSEPPDYSKMDWAKLSATATGEIKQRLISKWRLFKMRHTLKPRKG